MTRIHRIFIVPIVFLAAIPLVQLASTDLQNSEFTVLREVTPTEVRPRDVVTVTGVALDASHVKEIYLTNGEVDYRVEILEQSNLRLRLRVPAKINAGVMRFAVVVVNRPELLEQPVLLKILPIVG